MAKTATSAAKRKQKRAKQAPGRPRRKLRSARAIEATLAEIAHEIRTPLTGILALGELLATSELGERERGWAAAIKSTRRTSDNADLACHRCRACRGQRHRAAARSPAAAPDRRGAGRSLAARAETKGLAAEAVIADDLPETAIGDALRLRAALENLVDNAVKFTDRGACGWMPRGEPRGRSRGRLVFTVSDSGIGLSARRDQAPVPSVRASQRQDRATLRRCRARSCSRQADCDARWGAT